MKILVIIQLILVPVLGFTQEWSPIGAEWYYDITYAWSGDINYHRIYCDSIHEINGTDCKRVVIDYRACNNYYNENLYTYENEDTIFFYNFDIDSFQILYDFNAQPGDEWVMYIKNEFTFQKIIAHVDSISTIDINSYNLPVLYMTYTYYHDVGNGLELLYNYNSTIIKNLGDLYFLINIIHPGNIVCDKDKIFNLRCYQDPEIGFYSTGHRDSCDYTYKWTNIEEYPISSLRIYPNPVADYLYLKNDSGSNFRYYLYDTNGQLMLRGVNTRIDLRFLHSGLYFIKIITDQNYYETFKILKH